MSLLLARFDGLIVVEDGLGELGRRLGTKIKGLDEDSALLVLGKDLEKPLQEDVQVLLLGLISSGIALSIAEAKTNGSLDIQSMSPAAEAMSTFLEENIIVVVAWPISVPGNLLIARTSGTEDGLGYGDTRFAAEGDVKWEVSLMFGSLEEPESHIEFVCVWGGQYL